MSITKTQLKDKNNTSTIIYPETSADQIKQIPVGTVYMTFDNSFSPGSFFGGSWVKVEDKFLFSTGSKHSNSNVTGGSNDIKLLKHSHSVFIGAYGTDNVYAYTHDAGSSYGATLALSSTLPPGFTYPVNTSDSYRVGARTITNPNSFTAMDSSKIAEDSSNNNMPSYVTVHIWKKIS